MIPLCVDKHSELPPGERKYKGRAAFEGFFVSDQNSIVFAFEELAPSASLTVSTKMIDTIGRQQGWTIQQPGAQQAFTQSELNGRAGMDLPATSD